MRLSTEYLSFPGWKYAIGAIVVVALGWYVFVGFGKSPEATLTISSGDFREQVSVSGTVVATKDVTLGFAASGRIAGTYATVGQYVGAGTVLAEIENGDLVAVLAQKRSALVEAEVDLAQLRSGTRSEELNVATAAVANAESELIDAIRSAYTSSDDAVHNKADSFFTNPRSSDPKLIFSTSDSSLKGVVERDRVIVETTLKEWADLVSKLDAAHAAESAMQAQIYLEKVVTLLADANAAVNQGLPDAPTSSATLSSYATTLATGRTNVNAAATTLTAEKSALDTAKKNLALKQAGSTTAEILAQEAVVAAAQADVESARALLAKTRVVAPFNGTITRMDAKVGEIVSPSDSKIEMQSSGIFQIETYVPETSISRIAVGNPATTTLDAYGSAMGFPSVVVAVDPAETVKDGVPAYKTILAFLTKDARIRSGMTANVSIQTGMLRDAIVIPSGAVGTKDGTRYVTVVENEENANRTVTLGSSPALGQAHILSGLSAGEVILLAPVP